MLSPALIDNDNKQSLQEEEKRPWLKIISAPKAESKKKEHKLLPMKSAVSSESYCLVPCRLPASALLKRGPG